MNMAGLNDITLAEALASLSRQEVFEALDREDEAVVAAVSEFIGILAEQVGLVLKDGKDYLEMLTPDDNTPAVLAVAMDIVLETLEEELESEDE